MRKFTFSVVLLAIGLMGFCAPALADSRTDLQELVDQIRQSESQYFLGTSPGYNDAGLVQAYEEALLSARTALAGNTEGTDYETLYSALYDAWSNVDLESLIPMSDGYYFFVNGWPNYKNYQGVRKAIVSKPDDYQLYWGTFDPNDLNQVWKVVTVEGGFSVQNVGTGKFIGAGGENSAGAYVPLTDEQTVAQVFRHLTGSPLFNIANTQNEIAYHPGDHGDGWHAGGPIVTWWGGAYEASSWEIVEVSDYQLEQLQNGTPGNAYVNLENAVYEHTGKYYPMGITPGFFDAEKVRAFTEAFLSATAGLAEEHTNDEYQALADNLIAAGDAVVNGLVPVGDGYYFIVNAALMFEMRQNVRKAMTARGSDALGWDTWNDNDVRQLWKVTALEGGTYSIQNAATKMYIGGSGGAGSALPMTEEQTVGQIFRHLDGSAQFNIANTQNDIAYHTGDHGDGWHANGPVVTWWGGSNTASAWFVEPVTDEDIINQLLNGKSEAYMELQTLVDNIEAEGSTFFAGTNPGYNDETKVNAFDQALAAAKAALEGTADDETYAALKETLATTWEEVKDSRIPVTDGYYYFINGWPAYENLQGEKKAMYAGYDHQLSWGNYKERDPQQVWKVTDLGTGGFSIQNVGTGEYIGAVDGVGSYVPMTAAQSVEQVFRFLDGAPQFNIANTQNDIAYHTGGHDNGWGESGSIVTWWGGAYEASSWEINRISDEDEINYIVNEIANRQKLTSLINNPPTYITGIDPGCYDAEKVEAFLAVLASVAEEYENSDADVSALLERLNAAIAAVEESLIPVTDGYYYFVNAMPEYENLQGIKKAIQATLDTHTLTWNSYDPNNPLQVFRVTSLEDGNFSVQNVVTSEYVVSYNGSSVTTAAEHSIGQTFTQITNALPQFKLANVSDPTGYHTGGHDFGAGVSGPIVTWNTGVNEASAWYIVRVSDEELLDQILNVLVYKAKLDNYIEKVNSYVSKFKAGEEYGDVTDEQWEAIQNAISEASAYGSNPDREGLEARLAALEANFDLFKSQQIQFEPNQWYFFVSRDMTRGGSYIDGTGNGNIYDTFIYGNVFYTTSDNTQSAGSWGDNNKNAVHWGYYKRTSTDREDTSGEALYREINDPHTMWRLVPIEDKDGQYALQNRASGKYLENYIGNTASWLHQMDAPQPYVLTLLASGQYGIRPPEATNYLQLAGDGYLYPAGTSDSENSPWAFTLEAVEDEDEPLKLQIQENSIQIMSLPYAIDDTYESENGNNNILTYTLVGWLQDDDGYHLCLNRQDTFEAGEPFVLVAGDYTAYSSDGDFVSFKVPYINEFSQEEKSVNGLTATLDFVTAPSEGLGVLAGSKLQPAAPGQGIDGHTGWIDLSAVPQATEEGDLMLTLPAEMADGINLPSAVFSKGKEAVYNLAGQMVNGKLHRGIYIIGKKKVIVK